MFYKGTMASINPTYNYDDFKNACKDDPNDFFLTKAVLDNARKIFNLKTKKDLLSFISNDGLEDIEFVNTTPWKNNPDKNINIYVDAYKFKSLSKSAYIAFFHSSKTGKWTIKSFHLSDDRNKTMEIAMGKARLLKRLKGEKDG